VVLPILQGALIVPLSMVYCSTIGQFRWAISPSVLMKLHTGLIC